jgi:hypothetical protein
MSPEDVAGYLGDVILGCVAYFALMILYRVARR